ncbi:MAG TPA: hypothetical protein VKA31_08805 [Mariprofundaceae bacterium]|nr:hypothetical protein [Mariprofundaceae bacterium]
MTSDIKPQHNDRAGLWMLLAVIIATAAVFLWTSTHYQHGDTSLDTRVDSQGHLHVLGVTLGVTTLREAETILQSKSDVALYIYPQEHPKAGMKLEAFFPSIADHTKVILLLAAGPDRLKKIESDATVPHLYPNGVARMNLAAADAIGINNATVQELTLIPNLAVSAETLKARFGEPDHIQHLQTDQDLYLYNRIGLQAFLSKDEPPTLHFSNPPADH